MGRHSRNFPPGPKGQFLFGNARQYLHDPLGFLTWCAREYGDVVRLKFANTVCYLLSNPDDIRRVLLDEEESFRKDRLTQNSLPLFGKSLLTSEGAVWRRQRGRDSPPFLAASVREYSAIVVAHSEKMLASWRDGEARNISREMARLTFGIFNEAIFGVAMDDSADEVIEDVDSIMEYYANPLSWSWVHSRLPVQSALRFRRAVRRLEATAEEIVRRRRAAGPGPDDLLSRWLSALEAVGEDRMTVTELRDEMMTFLLAGHETTALTLTYCLFLITQHPVVEARLLNELTEALGGRNPTPTDIQSLTYTEWVLREAMRLYPPAWCIGREADTRCEIGGFDLPRGGQVMMSQWVVHRDPRHFEEPDTFQPERWDGHESRRPRRGSYFPFSDGPRACIGGQFAIQEATLVLAMVLRQFRLELAPGQTGHLELLPSLTLRPRGGVMMTVHAQQGPVERGPFPNDRSAPTAPAPPR